MYNEINCIKSKSDLIIGLNNLIKDFQSNHKNAIKYAFIIHDTNNNNEILTITNINNQSSLIHIHKSLYIILSNSKQKKNCGVV